MNKHIPLRMCMSCREMKPKDELIRLVSVDNMVVIDEKSNIQARGAYVCKSTECVSLLKKKRGIEKNLKVDAKDLYDRLFDFVLNKE